MTIAAVQTQCVGPLEFSRVPRFDDGPRDTARTSLLPVSVDQIGELRFTRLRKQLRQGLPRAGVHSHIEWTIGAEGESPFGSVELG